MKIVVIGADGQLGTDIYKILKDTQHEIIGLTIEDIEISKIDSVASALKEARGELVINTAAYHNVEKCEQNPIRAFEVNGVGSINLSQVCNDLDSTLLHISTDYVFDGEKRDAYIETDKPLPLNVYGNTKLSGEHFIESIAKKYYILRVSGIYGKNPCLAKGGYNFVELMLKLAKERDEVRVVDNEILTPTSTVEISLQIKKMIENDIAYGVYHVTAEGSCSWYQFAKEIFSIAKTDILLNKAAPGEFAVKVNRPEYSVLENSRLKDQQINIMRHWKEGLKTYLTGS
jgi:dTDP-4-dehydrorhamnose reductase